MLLSFLNYFQHLRLQSPLDSSCLGTNARNQTYGVMSRVDENGYLNFFFFQCEQMCTEDHLCKYSSNTNAQPRVSLANTLWSVYVFSSNTLMNGRKQSYVPYCIYFSDPEINSHSLMLDPHQTWEINDVNTSPFFSSPFPRTVFSSILFHCTFSRTPLFSCFKLRVLVCLYLVPCMFLSCSLFS